MQYTSTLLAAAFAATTVLAHGTITEVQGANGVSMPGLTIVDGTPRDCSTARCGAQSDTAVIRNAELGTARASALGRTSGLLGFLLFGFLLLPGALFWRHGWENVFRFDI